MTAGLADAPHLYDLLDVAPDADADEIRAAWKGAIADLGPDDRRFRAYNQAAELLLDPERRAAYDAELAARRRPSRPSRRAGLSAAGASRPRRPDRRHRAAPSPGGCSSPSRC